MAELSTWLQKAIFVWFVAGNISQQVAVELVEKANGVFATTPIAVSDIPAVTPFKLEDGKAILVESALDDKKNENSCVVTTFDCGLV